MKEKRNRLIYGEKGREVTDLREKRRMKKKIYILKDNKIRLSATWPVRKKGFKIIEKDIIQPAGLNNLKGKEKRKMKKGDVKINLKNLDGQDLGEYLITDGQTHTLYSPYRPEGVGLSNGLLKAVLRDHAGMTIADLAVVLLSPCDR